MLKIKVKYHYEGMPKLEQLEDSDCIDLRVCNITNLPIFRFHDGGWDIYPGEEIFVDLGIFKILDICCADIRLSTYNFFAVSFSFSSYVILTSLLIGCHNKPQ